MERSAVVRELGCAEVCEGLSQELWVRALGVQRELGVLLRRCGTLLLQSCGNRGWRDVLRLCAALLDAFVEPIALCSGTAASCLRSQAARRGSRRVERIDKL